VQLRGARCVKPHRIIESVAASPGQFVLVLRLYSHEKLLALLIARSSRGLLEALGSRCRPVPALRALARSEASSGGTATDIGEALDTGKLSPDGTQVALLRNRSACSAQFVCADLVVVPARGGSETVIARGFRLFGNPSGTAGLTA
jgi:hypothetical protein